ncbi:DMT family transporter [Pseudomonas sp. Marseille-QA0892]
MSARSNSDALSVGMMFGLCAIWGLQQVAIKWAAADIAPVMQAALRSGLSAVLVALLITAVREWRHMNARTWRPGLAAGALFCLEFFCIALGLQYTTAGHMVVFLYTAPIFVALGLHMLQPSERLKPLQWLGVGVCFVGIAVAFGGGIDTGAINSRMLIGDALGVLAGLLWGMTTITVRVTSLSETPPAVTLFYQLGVAFAGLLLIAWGIGQIGHVQLTAVSISSVAFQGVVVSFMSFLLWFWLLRRYRASDLSILSFMAPMYGVAFGVWLLGEPLEPSFVLGALMVLSGITLVSAEARVRRWLSA